MLGHSHDRSSVRNRNGGLTGLGSHYSPQPYLDILHRGYGWGRIMDLDNDFALQAKMSAPDSYREVNGLTPCVNENRKTIYPLQWK